MQSANRLSVYLSDHEENNSRVVTRLRTRWWRIEKMRSAGEMTLADPNARSLEGKVRWSA